jgi:hypothetical protein
MVKRCPNEPKMSCRSLHSYNDLNKKTQTTGHDFVAGFSKATEVAMCNDGLMTTAMATSLRTDFGAKIK